MTHKPDSNSRQLVAKWARRGETQEYIAKRLGITRTTLCEHYDYEVHHSKIDLCVEIEDKLVDKAREGDWKALEMFLRTRAGLYDAKAPTQLVIKDKEALVQLQEELSNESKPKDAT